VAEIQTLINCSRCTEYHPTEELKRIEFAGNIFYICVACLPTTLNNNNEMEPFQWDYFCSPCEWFGFVDEAKYSEKGMSCPICGNTGLETNERK
jgi:hypothetical protein